MFDASAKPPQKVLPLYATLTSFSNLKGPCKRYIQYLSRLYVLYGSIPTSASYPVRLIRTAPRQVLRMRMSRK
ncbi:hypothetical protein GLAREA_07553 [Glarea lozoyensis ATCC 20868]|uniref:Uncharacterized protein n=1 Tax=Glarea lozoyensis (strain ATCC 20868 / MF5171) TaxID=1116229 RepID=S3D3Q7_GLAL2|nr:uncharacterized protein GLAREA_07553 [Glarea lozoyensis ATCC 20868]EPE32420.1 hypothetical protein GLAREA_07553 [Glarea lozoyensis ATCC 20868]